MNIQEIAYHRNGVSGEPFYVVTFSDPDAAGDTTSVKPHTSPRGEMVAVVFDIDADEPSWRTAVLDRELLGAGVIAFAENSWRGDHYDRDLRQAIRANERRLSEEWSNAGVKP